MSASLLSMLAYWTYRNDSLAKRPATWSISVKMSWLICLVCIVSFVTSSHWLILMYKQIARKLNVWLSKCHLLTVRDRNSRWSRSFEVRGDNCVRVYGVFFPLLHFELQVAFESICWEWDRITVSRQNIGVERFVSELFIDDFPLCYLQV